MNDAQKFVPVPISKHHRFRNLIGQSFGRLTITGYLGPDIRGKARWLCRCDCGTEKSVAATALIKGITNSCGCLRSELLRSKMFIHGHSRHPMYAMWRQMLARCRNPNHPYYERYGGRGISVCERWNDFYTFLEDVGEKPSTTHSLDRKDNDGDYEPVNCRWATKTQQSNNARSNLIVEYKGERKTLANWCRKLNLRYPTIYRRIRLVGQSPEVAFKPEM